MFSTYPVAADAIIMWQRWRNGFKISSIYRQNIIRQVGFGKTSFGDGMVERNGGHDPT
jgi:hypothetical protein